MTPERKAELAARLPKGGIKGRRMVKISALTIAKLMSAMLHEPSGLSIHELIEASGLSDGVVRDYMVAMQRERAAYVKGWDRDAFGRYNTKLWAIGDKDDAKRPAPEDRAEQSKRYRVRREMAARLNLPRAAT